MKKLLAALLCVMMLLSLCACSDDYEILAGKRKEIQTTVILDPADMLLGSWYFTDNGDHFLEFYEDGTAKCFMIPEIPYTYTFDGKILTLTTPDFTRTYECTITEDGYLTYTWDNEGELITEFCEKR